jgi:hypothetical protein
MAYAKPNFKTKKELKDAIARGDAVTAFEPSIGTVPRNGGPISIEGPHFPKPHTWYADAWLTDGRIVKVR